MNRRDFLRALGVSALTVPFLPSWILRELRADPRTGPLKLVGFFPLSHGGDRGWAGLGRPAADGLSYIRRNAQAGVGSVGSVPIRAQQLSECLNPDGSLGAVWSSEWNRLGLLPYLNIYQGIDCGRNSQHGFLSMGNASSVHNDLPTSDPGNLGDPVYGPTMDCAIAQSEVYSPRDGSRAPAWWMAWNGRTLTSQRFPGMSYRLADPADLMSSIESAGWVDRADQFYGLLNPPSGDAQTNAANQAALNRVIQEMAGLRSNSLLSASDRGALDAHVTRLDRLRITLAAMTCGAHPVPAREAIPERSSTHFLTVAGDFNTYFGRSPVLRGINAFGMPVGSGWLDLLDYLLDLVAFRASTYSSCFRPVVLAMPTKEFPGLNGTLRFPDESDMHSNYFHWVDSTGNALADRRTKLVNVMLPWIRGQIDNVVLGLARRLKEIPSDNGRNLLDDSLLALLPEAGPKTHQHNAMQAAWVGGANGRIRTGWLVEFGDPNLPLPRGRVNGSPTTGEELALDPLVPRHSMVANHAFANVGLPLINFMNSIMRAAGLDPSAYSRPDMSGGYFRYANIPDAYRSLRTTPHPAAFIDPLFL